MIDPKLGKALAEVMEQLSKMETTDLRNLADVLQEARRAALEEVKNRSLSATTIGISA